MSVTEADTEINPTEMAAENKNDMKWHESLEAKSDMKFILQIST